MKSWFKDSNQGEAIITEVTVSDDRRYVLMTVTGAVSSAEIKVALDESRPLYNYSDRLLVDCRQADISPLGFIELDDLGASFNKAVPGCKKMAFVIAQGADNRAYAHLANIHCIYGVEAEIFDTMAATQDWLLEVF
ncbi:MAG: hypothetical protein ACI9W6_001172 [Motiliproteus sp.]|jgi:hypothetical protein